MPNGDFNIYVEPLVQRNSPCSVTLTITQLDERSPLSRPIGRRSLRPTSLSGGPRDADRRDGVLHPRSFETFRLAPHEVAGIVPLHFPVTSTIGVLLHTADFNALYLAIAQSLFYNGNQHRLGACAKRSQYWRLAAKISLSTVLCHALEDGR